MRPDPLRGLARPLLAVLAPLLFTLGCGGEEYTSVSAKARVNAKSGAVWGRDLANGLGLQEWELCSELGAYDCISEAHRITLGGVEPTVLGIDEPLPNASVSAPIAVDRVATSACGLRFDRDKSGGAAVIFGPVLQKDNDRAREDVADALVRRLLSREPTKAELESLVALYDSLAPISTDLTRDGAVGMCVIVATSTEALFY